MSEPNIVLARIDNRLIHGQVVTQWCGAVNADMIVVANDAVAGDRMRQGLMDMAAPDGVATRYLTIQGTIEGISKAGDQKVMLLVENPQDALALVKGGVPIHGINVGIMHAVEGKRQVSSSVSVDDADVAAFRELRDANVSLEIRRVPSTPAEDASGLFA